MPWPSFSAAPTVEIEFDAGDNNIFFLYPSSDPEMAPVGDTIVAGNVVLDLPHPRRIKVVAVELVRRTAKGNNTALLTLSFAGWCAGLSLQTEGPPRNNASQANFR